MKIRSLHNDPLVTLSAAKGLVHMKIRSHRNDLLVTLSAVKGLVHMKIRSHRNDKRDISRDICIK